MDQGLVRLYISRIHLDADRLTNQVHRQDKTGFGGVLSHEAADDAAQRAVHDFHHRPFANHWTRVVLQLAPDEQANAVDLVVRNRRRLPLERHDVHHAGALEDRQRIDRLEPRKTVAGKQGPIDPFLAVLPPAPSGNGRQERVYLFSLELVAHDVLVPRPRPDGEPLDACDLGFGAWDSV